jgi:hypothetical protein
MALAALALLGCEEDKARMVSGRIFDGPNSGVSVSNVDIDVMGLSGETITSAQADGRGTFSVEVPESSTFFLVLSKDGWVTTSFTGVVGLSDVRSPDGSLYLRDPAVQDDFLADFAHCPRAGSSGGSVDGIMRLYLLNSYEAAEEMPILDEGFAWVDTEEETVVGCYLPDEEGNPAEYTGESGRLAVLDLAPGVATLNIAYSQGVDVNHADVYPIYVPEGGVVPLLPVYATLP